METLSRLLQEFVSAEAKRLDQTYEWEIPSGWPLCDFERDVDSRASANIRFRRALSVAWHARRDDRAIIERWYVAEWGGIRSNRAKTFAAYSGLSDEQLISRAMKGIASWSKILVIRNPQAYAIYDARVAAALNALQRGSAISAPLLFPHVPSRNKIIHAYQESESTSSRAAQHIPRKLAYRTYLNLLTNVAGALRIPMIDPVEMCLFANAERLAAAVL